MTRRRAVGVGAFAAVVVGVGAAWHAGQALILDVPVMAPQVLVSLASHEWERLPETARLAAQNPQAVVLLTRPLRATEFNCHDCGNRVRRLVELGVPPARIRLLTLPVRNTYDEAVAVRAYLQQTGARRVFIVTSLYHTRRALAAFRHALRRVPASIGVVGAPWPAVHPARWWDSKYGRWYVAREWAATFYYCVRHPEFVRQVPLRPW